MKIQVENYFGNDVLTLNYHQKDVNISKGVQIHVGVIASHYGYDVADVDTDEDGQEFIRVQEVNVDNSEVQGKDELIDMVSEFNKRFL